MLANTEDIVVEQFSKTYSTIKIKKTSWSVPLENRLKKQAESNNYKIIKRQLLDNCVQLVLEKE